MIVKEILEEPYYTESFPGYENIDISFTTLQSIYKQSDAEWKTALSIKGIYLITDTKTGKRYVGKADSDGGIWRRWRHYIRNGHGGDVDLERLINTKGFDYVKTTANKLYNSTSPHTNYLHSHNTMCITLIYIRGINLREAGHSWILRG